jgi:HEAT repeat protein
MGRARSLLVTQQRRYAKAATAKDGVALLARVQAALAKQGDGEAAAWLAQHAAPAADTGRARGRDCPAEDDEDDLRIAAINGLLQMDADKAVPLLRTVLARRDACHRALRRKAVFILSQKHTAETEDILLDVAQHDPDSDVRQQAVFWLSQVPTERAVTMLDSILRTTDDEELREKALFALSQQHSPRAGQILRGYAETATAPSEARLKAIFWLGQRPSAENAAFLRALYAKLSNDELKEKVIFSLSQSRSAENNRWLIDLALNERESIEMRKKALFWAGQTGGDLDELAALYDRMQNHDMKEQLVFVYSQRHETAALDKLIQIAKTEPDRELRRKAIFWLGQSHDPRAAQVLLEIINQ